MREHTDPNTDAGSPNVWDDNDSLGPLTLVPVPRHRGRPGPIPRRGFDKWASVGSIHNYTYGQSNPRLRPIIEREYYA